jgi:hypothetical protein
MPRESPYKIVLTERRELIKRAKKYTLPYFTVSRARMIILASQGLSNDEIAYRLDTPRKVVSMWRNDSLKNASLDLMSDPVRDAPRFFPPEIIVQVKEMACELPPRSIKYRFLDGVLPIWQGGSKIGICSHDQ